MAEFLYCWGPRIKGWPKDSPLRQLDRKGERCRIIARGAKNSIMVAGLFVLSSSKAAQWNRLLAYTVFELVQGRTE